MVMKNELEEEREPLNTRDMLENAFFANLGKKGTKIPVEAENTSIPKTANTDSSIDVENILMQLYETRDGLIESVSKMGVTSSSESIVTGINKIGGCIKKMGGQVQKFDLLSHLSGLKSPNLKKNAMRVIENTKEAYNIGKITEASISEDGKTIHITFMGQQDNVDYKAVGTIISPKTWVGNEAIDYLYSPSEGRMSVKAYNEEGKWLDKSGSYEISWELFEKEADLNVMPVEVVKESEKKKEITKDAKKDNSEEDNDFPIEEK